MKIRKDQRTYYIRKEIRMIREKRKKKKQKMTLVDEVDRKPLLTCVAALVHIKLNLELISTYEHVHGL
jgi:hypothetical protein